MRVNIWVLHPHRSRIHSQLFYLELSVEVIHEGDMTKEKEEMI